MSSSDHLDNGFWCTLPNKKVNPADKSEVSEFKKRYGFVEPYLSMGSIPPPIDELPKIFIRWGQEPAKGTEWKSIQNDPHPHRHDINFPITDYVEKFPFVNPKTNEFEDRNRCQKCHNAHNNNGEDCCGMGEEGWVCINPTNIFTWDELLKEYASCYLKEEENLFLALKSKMNNQKRSNKNGKRR
tara:strand:+ start:46 stop:600 length:555 start_codon:yes stop_codon:yes gene_type:complete